MTKSHYKLDLTVDVVPLVAQLKYRPNIWDEHPYRRTAPGSPHYEMQDIWIRANKIPEDLDFSHFGDEHDSVWYPVYELLPGCRDIIFDVMRAAHGERLGGVLITKLPPGGIIRPHQDSGWHAEYYDKYYVPIQNKPGATFSFQDGVIQAEPGEVWYFKNDDLHWVENYSVADRIAMIICIRRT